jgi:hypothetical protein
MCGLSFFGKEEKPNGIFVRTQAKPGYWLLPTGYWLPPDTRE